MKRVSLVNLLVNDQDEAIRFYRDKLGFVVAEDVPFGEERWVTMKAPDDESVAISIGLAKTDEDRRLVGHQGGSQPWLAMRVDDCIAEYKHMKSAGVKFRGEPQVQPYGTGVTLEDLYGNTIYINQEPS